MRRTTLFAIVLSCVTTLAFAEEVDTSESCSLAAPGAIGILEQGTGEQLLEFDLSLSQLLSTWESMAAAGYRLVDLESYVGCHDARYFGGAFRPGSGQTLAIGWDWRSFMGLWAQWLVDGYRLVDLETYKVGSTRVYCGVFHAGDDRVGLVDGLEWNVFWQACLDKGEDGLRLVDIETYVDGGTRYYSGVFRTGAPGGLWVAPWESFVGTWHDWTEVGLDLIDVETFQVGQQAWYAGVYAPSGNGHVFFSRSNDPSSELDTFKSQGFRIADFEYSWGNPVATLKRFPRPRPQLVGQSELRGTTSDWRLRTVPRAEMRMLSTDSPTFIRGDTNGDGELGMNDALAILKKLYAGGRTLDCADAADANDNGEVEMADALVILNFLYAGKTPPAGARPGEPQVDTTADKLGCNRESDRKGRPRNIADSLRLSTTVVEVIREVAPKPTAKPGQDLVTDSPLTQVAGPASTKPASKATQKVQRAVTNSGSLRSIH